MAGLSQVSLRTAAAKHPNSPDNPRYLQVYTFDLSFWLQLSLQDDSKCNHSNSPENRRTSLIQLTEKTSTIEPQMSSMSHFDNQCDVLTERNHAVKFTASDAASSLGPDMQRDGIVNGEGKEMEMEREIDVILLRMLALLDTRETLTSFMESVVFGTDTDQTKTTGTGTGTSSNHPNHPDHPNNLDNPTLSIDVFELVHNPNNPNKPKNPEQSHLRFRCPVLPNHTPSD